MYECTHMCVLHVVHVYVLLVMLIFELYLYLLHLQYHVKNKYTIPWYVHDM